MILVDLKLKFADLDVVKHDLYINLDVFANISTNSYNPNFPRIFIDWKAREGNS